MKIVFSKNNDCIEFCFAQDYDEALEILKESKRLIEDALFQDVEITIVKD